MSLARAVGGMEGLVDLMQSSHSLQMGILQRSQQQSLRNPKQLSQFTSSGQQRSRILRSPIPTVSVQSANSSGCARRSGIEGPGQRPYLFIYVSNPKNCSVWFADNPRNKPGCSQGWHQLMSFRLKDVT